MSKVVTIIGMSATSLAGADLEAKDGELWGLNAAFQMKELKKAKWTRWFDMHALDYLSAFCPERWAYMKALTIPCYMLKADSEIPHSVAYPRAEVNEYLRLRFGSEPDYFTSSFSYMIALALFEGFGEIRLYGIDLMDEFELPLERPGAEYLIGLARGCGVRVILSPASPLLYTSWPYGYEEPRLTLHWTERAAWRVQQVAGILSTPARLPRANDSTSDESLRFMKARYIWMRNYGHPGTLLKKDGSVN